MSLVLIAPAALAFSIGDCIMVENVAIVCITDMDGTSCTSTSHWDLVCGGGGGGGGTGGSGGTGGIGGGGGGTFSAFDTNADGVLDSWNSVVETDDPCAYNFDFNDRLGSNHGGPNTQRPGHTGVDIQADYNDRVRAMKAGTVIVAGNIQPQGCGYQVTVHHDDGSFATYCHLVNGSAQVAVNGRVHPGVDVARANSTGNSTGHHVHLVYTTPGGNRDEYFNATGNGPGAANLNSGGC